MSDWTALPAGQSITTVPGDYYAVIANVKASHTQAQLVAMAASKWGLTVSLYVEQGDPSYPNLVASTDPNYKTIYAVGQATKVATVPWSVPSSVAWLVGDSSHLAQAWWSSTDPAVDSSSPTSQANHTATSPAISVAGGTITPTEVPVPDSQVITAADVGNIAPQPIAGFLIGMGIAGGVYLLWQWVGPGLRASRVRA
jgi:hypothetical protein